MITWEDFEKVEIRVGKIIKVEDFPEVRIPAYKMEIDFGEEIGIKKSCGQYVKNYSKKDLKNKLVLGVINFPPKQIGPAISEVLTLGVEDADGNAILVVPDKKVKLGERMY